MQQLDLIFVIGVPFLLQADRRVETAQVAGDNGTLSSKCKLFNHVFI